MSQHRAPVRPRYGRMAALGLALGITLVAVLGSIGALPALSGADGTPAAASVGHVALLESAQASLAATVTAPEGSTQTGDETETGTTDQVVVDPKLDTSLPAASGAGKRIVFSEGRQRVWLVGSKGAVQRTYLVSGSVYDNLDPGTYAVYSRSEQAWGIDDSGTMKYFVRFTQGENAAIGFHDIPVDNKKFVQTVAQLGTPLSHGCIRQKRSDALALWKFAPLGTSVVVTA